MTDSRHVERCSKGRARNCVVSGFPKHEGGEAIPTRAACSAPLMQKHKTQKKTTGKPLPSKRTREGKGLRRRVN